MNKALTILFPLLLLSATQVHANRPGAEESPMGNTETEAMGAPAQQTVIQHSIGDAIEITPGETIDINLLDFPRRGMTMKKVLNELGKPHKISETVGKPPITHWTYKDRTVYFEHATVIHVVATN